MVKGKWTPYVVPYMGVVQFGGSCAGREVSVHVTYVQNRGWGPKGVRAGDIRPDSGMDRHRPREWADARELRRFALESAFDLSRIRRRLARRVSAAARRRSCLPGNCGVWDDPKGEYRFMDRIGAIDSVL